MVWLYSVLTSTWREGIGLIGKWSYTRWMPKPHFFFISSTDLESAFCENFLLGMFHTLSFWLISCFCSQHNHFFLHNSQIINLIWVVLCHLSRGMKKRFLAIIIFVFESVVGLKLWIYYYGVHGIILDQEFTGQELDLVIYRRVASFIFVFHQSLKIA